jgi:hypothetical protein
MTDGNSAQSLRRRSHLVGRRELILLLSSAVTAPRALRAQQNAIPVIGFLSPFSAPGGPSPSMAAFHQGLGETGYVEGQNVAIEYRWAEAHYERLSTLAADLAFVALIEQAAHRFELLDGRCVSPSLKDELGKAQMIAAAVPCAEGSSVHEEELSADLGAGLLLRIGRGGKQRSAGRASSVERVGD